MNSGRVYCLVSGNTVCLSEYVIDHHLEEGEKPIWSIGSQAGMSGVVTNKNRVIAWRVHVGLSYIDRALRAKRKQIAIHPTVTDSTETDQLQAIEQKISELDISDTEEAGETQGQCTCFIVPPYDPETGEEFVLTKVAFGHRNWYAIGPTRRLYWLQLNQFPGGIDAAETCKLWFPVPNTGHLKIVDVDSGTNHSGLVTDEGDVYTWGDGAHGCLGHYDTEKVAQPKRVEYFKENGMKAVAIGCGGYIYWSGGFTIVLLDDNRLFYFGKLGNDHCQLFPTQVVVPNRLILSISAGEDWAGIVTCRHPEEE